jgi:hypothetical protein
MAGALLGTCRLVLGWLAVAAVVARLLEGADDPAFSVAGFFSYFTVQSNLLAAGVLLVTGFAALRGRPPTPRLELWRGAATLYMVTTGVAYSALLAADEPSLLRWTNVVLHYAMPVALALDWAVDRPRWRIAFGRAIAWMAFPVAFIAYTLARGAVADWYPYPFLDVAERGYPAVLATGVAIGLAMLGLSWLLASTTGPRADPVEPEPAR